MKNSLLALLLCVGGFASQAQIADYSFAENLVATTYHGEPYNLHEVLDSGYTVIVDVMATWCPPCWSWHEAEYFKRLDEQYGPNGTNELRVLMVESDSRTPENLLGMAANGGSAGTTSLGDWTAGVNYAIVNDDDFGDDYEIAYYPTVYAISPNRMVVEIGRHTDLTVYQDYAQNDPGTATQSPNTFALAYTGETSACGSDATASVRFQNLSLQPLNSVTLRVLDENGGVVLENTLNETFQPYEIRDVVIGAVPAAAYETSVLNATIEVVGAGDTDPSDNLVTATIGAPPAVTDSMRLELTTDFWVIETGLQVRDGDGTLVLNETYDGLTNGGGADANKVFNYNLQVDNEDFECWTFTVTDSYGDGADQYPSTAPVPGLRLYAANGDVIFIHNFVEETFETITSSTARIQRRTTVGTQSPVAAHLDVYPNPASAGGVLVVTLADLASNHDIEARLVNSVGQTIAVYNAQPAARQLTFDVPSRAKGIHYLQLTSPAGTSLLKVSIN